MTDSYYLLTGAEDNFIYSEKKIEFDSKLKKINNNKKILNNPKPLIDMVR